MLAQLLPGFRNVRAPLLAGYLWFAACWLLLYEVVPTGPAAREDYPDFYALADFIGPAGVLAVVSVLGYFVGGLTLQVTAHFTGVSLTAWTPGRANWHIYQIRPRLEREASKLDSNSPVLEQVDQHFRNRDEPTVSVLVTGPLGVGLSPEALDRAAREVASDLSLDGQDEVALRLRTADEPLFTEYDRLRAEGEVREAIAAPGLLLTVASLLSLRAGLLIEAIIAVSAILLLGLLFVQGYRSKSAARELLATAVAQGTIDTPTIDIIKAAQSRQGPRPPQAGQVR